MQLTKNVHVETKIWGCNIGYLLTDEGSILIDTPQRPTVAMQLKEALERFSPVRYIINTECHRDHFTGAGFFTAPVIAHENTRDAILKTAKETVLSRVSVIDPEGYQLMESWKANPPAITFSEKLTLHLGGSTVECLHHPGHTDGQTSVLLREEGVLFTGDNVFFKTQAFLNSGNVYRWMESLDEIAKLDFEYIVPGHGEDCGKSYLSEQKEFIAEWIQAVRRAIDNGWSKEEAVARISFEERYPMSIGTEDLMKNVQKNNVSYLYDMLLKESVASK